MAVTLLDEIERWARERPGHIAFRFLRSDESVGDEVTYGALWQTACAIGRTLAARVPTGGRALLLFGTEPSFVEAFLGCLTAGVIGVPADTPHGRRAWGGVERIIADCQPSVILTTRSLEQRWDAPLQRLCARYACRVLTVEEALAASDDHTPRARVEHDDVAFLQYTSGSTSQPKGVMVTHANIIANVRMIQAEFELGGETQTVSWLPFFHDMGLIGFVLLPLHLGCTSTLLSPTTFLEKPVRWLRAIARYRGTFSCGPNFAYELCCAKVRPEERIGLDLSSWVSAANGSEPVSIRTLRNFREMFTACGFRADAFRPCYGMAEATLFISAAAARRQIRVLPAVATPSSSSPAWLASDEGVLAEAAFRIESTDIVGCGRAAPGLTIRIVDPVTRIPRRDGEVGEVWIQGANVAAGYWANVEATAAGFGARLAGPERDGPYLRTGDLGCLDDGELFLVGRLKELLIIRGRNIVPQDVEEIVAGAHAAIRPGHVAAVGLANAGAQELAIVAEIERAHWRTVDPDAVVEAVLEAVQAEFGLAVAGVTLLRPGGLPKTTSGKRKRLECARRLTVGGPDRVYDTEWDVLHEWRVPGFADPHPARESHDMAAATAALTIDGLDRNALAEVVLLWLRTRLAQTLQCRPDDVADEEPFARVGLDSAGAVTLTGELSAWLRLDLTPTIFWEHRHPAALADHLADEVIVPGRIGSPVELR